MSFPSSVKLVEVSPRDGLQNESTLIPTRIKIEFINQLSQSGLQVIETTSFVSAKWVPQLADHREVFGQIIKHPKIRYPVLVANRLGLKNAIATGVKEIAIFTTPSEKFSKRNTNSSVNDSLKKITEIIQLAKQYNIHVRGYISCVLGCPYEGEIAPILVAEIAEKLMNLGCYEISLGDTIGIGTPNTTKLLLDTVMRKISRENIAVHFHDTLGKALANIHVALQNGISIIDCSVTGLGGCPYAKGSSGNVATEEVWCMLNNLGIQTGVDFNKLIQAGKFIRDHLITPAQTTI